MGVRGSRGVVLVLAVACGADDPQQPVTPRSVYLEVLQDCGLATPGKLEGLPWFLHDAPDLATCQRACLEDMAGECDDLSALVCDGELPAALRACLAPCQERSCEDGQVVPASYLCDGEAFCSLASDESECDLLTQQFACAQGRGSVAVARVCDLSADCGDASDEPADCARRVCAASAACEVDESRKCDAYVDCADGRDEVGCGGVACDALRCDGQIDCEDGRDERGCPTEACPEELRCNDVVECALGIDEVDCVTSPCPDAVYCDGVVECPNGQDEIDCSS